MLFKWNGVSNIQTFIQIYLTSAGWIVLCGTDVDKCLSDAGTGPQKKAAHEQ